MTRQWPSAAAVAMIFVPLVAIPASAQMPTPSMASDCPPGTQYMPPGRDGAGNPTLAYCAADPTRGTNDPYAGSRNAPDPQGSPSSGGAGQAIAPSR